MSVIKQIFEDFNSTFIKSNVDSTVKLFTNFKHFMSRIESGNVSFSEALCFAILVSISMSFIGELANWRCLRQKSMLLNTNFALLRY